jgi:hypothetical protein
MRLAKPTTDSLGTRISPGSIARWCLLVWVAALPPSAHADGPYAGTWQASPMRVRVSIESWGGDCGRRPPTTSTEPGGIVQIRQTGAKLIMDGAMAWTTDRCFTPNRAARRQSATGDDASWRVVCRTPPDDSRAEHGTYTLRATRPDTLAFREESRYDWELKASRCKATRVAERTLTRKRQEGAATPPKPAEKTPEPTRPACTPGKAARLTLSPPRQVIEPGQRLCFQARVTDAQGCPIEDAQVRFSLAQPEGLRGTLKGRCFHAGETAAESEGTYRVTASSGALSRRAEVQVRAADLSDLIARGTLETRAAEDTLDGPEAQAASRVAARAGEDPQKLLGPIVTAAVVLLLLLGVAALLVVRRRRPPASLATPGVASPGAPPGAPAASTVAGGGLPENGAHAGAPTSPQEPMICPTCRRGYAPGSVYCTHDSETLVPYATFAKGQSGASEETAQERVCPQCGGRYGPGQTFCGKDGTRLVLVN